MGITTFGGSVIIPVGSGAIADGSVTNAKLGTDLAVGSTICFLPYSNYGTVVQGTWTQLINSTRSCCMACNNGTTHALNDEITFGPIWLAAGTYSAFLSGEQAADKGILTVYLGNTTLLTADEYAAGSAAEYPFTSSGTVLATSGLYSLRFKITSKNGASSSYGAYFHYLMLTRTA